MQSYDDFHAAVESRSDCLDLESATVETEWKPWMPEKLSPRHHMILAMRAAGVTNNDIAGALGMTPARVSVIVNHPLAQPILARLVGQAVQSTLTDVRTFIQAHAMEAMVTNVDLMRNSKKDEVRQRSVFDILDRAGFKPKEVVVNASVQVGEEGARLISTALRESVGEFYEPPAVETGIDLQEAREVK